MVLAHVPAENIELVTSINLSLYQLGLTPNEPDWNEVLEQSRYSKDALKENEQGCDEDAGYLDFDLYLKEMEEEYNRIIQVLNISKNDLTDYVFHYLQYESDEKLHELWEEKPWEEMERELEQSFHESETMYQDPFNNLDEEYHKAIEPGENMWSLERNAAAAGFLSIEQYLRWRLSN